MISGFSPTPFDQVVLSACWAVVTDKQTRSDVRKDAPLLLALIHKKPLSIIEKPYVRGD